ncbi:histidine phosphatase family protein [Candidatus Pelagibacter bacterium nBUS_49]|uniref:histidine phosphatase family protein n=1 Tax=Candidatus Pelagibacter bacterium nBUS_49 TaxID=3374196 RepID=UPI003EB6E1FF
MKFINFLLIIFITINSPVKADLNQNLINELKQGGKLIFIRHAYAPGGGDPKNFDINDCKTQRNLSNSGRNQAKKIGSFFKDNNILIDEVYSSEWCRCKETASLAFNDFEIKSFLNSFFSSQFAKNKAPQMEKLKMFISNWNEDKNLVFVTHYVVISESLNYAPSSGEIIISNKDFKVIDTIEIEY